MKRSSSWRTITSGASPRAPSFSANSIAAQRACALLGKVTVTRLFALLTAHSLSRPLTTYRDLRISSSMGDINNNRLQDLLRNELHYQNAGIERNQRADQHPNATFAYHGS